MWGCAFGPLASCCLRTRWYWAVVLPFMRHCAMRWTRQNGDVGKVLTGLHAHGQSTTGATSTSPGPGALCKAPGGPECAWRVFRVKSVAQMVTQALTARYTPAELQKILRHVEAGGELLIDIRLT